MFTNQAYPEGVGAFGDNERGWRNEVAVIHMKNRIRQICFRWWSYCCDIGAHYCGYLKILQI